AGLSEESVIAAAAGNSVLTIAPVDRIVTATGTQIVVAGSAIEEVRAAIALQNVREVGADQSLDVRQNVAGSVPAGSRPIVQTHVHRRQRGSASCRDRAA